MRRLPAVRPLEQVSGSARSHTGRGTFSRVSVAEAFCQGSFGLGAGAFFPLEMKEKTSRIGQYEELKKNSMAKGFSALLPDRDATPDFPCIINI
jgi:hypothetical protein